MEKLPAEVVKQLIVPMANQTGAIMDNTKEQADRLERNITRNVLEQMEAKLTARWGPIPCSAASSSTTSLDRQINHASKLTKGAELAAAKTPKAKAKDTERATAKEAAKA